MSIFKRSTEAPVDPVRRKATERLSRLSDFDVLNWTDQIGSAVAKAIDDYRRTKDPVALQDALQGLSTMAGGLDVLVSRSQ